jgi:hypothetical protein
MSTNITTLVLNLIISESRLHRIRIADKIIDLLETNVDDFGQIEKFMRNHFISKMRAYVENPSARTKDFLYEFADFYKEYYIGYVPELLAAA